MKQREIKFKPGKKHLEIFSKIRAKGKYKPAFSDKEPALVTLEKHGFVEWNGNFSGVVLTDLGKEFVKNL